MKILHFNHPFTLEESQQQQAQLLDQSMFPTPWKPDQWEELWLNSENYYLSMALENQGVNQRVIGLALFKLPPGRDWSQDQVHLLKLLIDTRQRRKGNGHKLLAGSLGFLSQRGPTTCYLEVEEDNLPAVSLYLLQGFKRVQRFQNYYGPSRHALGMLLELTQGPVVL